MTLTGFSEALTAATKFVWGPFLLIPLLIGTGLFLTFRLRGIQFRTLGRALRHGIIDQNDSDGEGDISNYQALTTALAATVGVGNIVGVATAIAIGGPGSLFWMWVTGLAGMASKYTEAYLGVRFRVIDSAGGQSGGPQQYLKRGIPGRLGKTLATLFAAFAALASFGIGNMTQANAVSAGLNDAFGWDKWIVAVVLFVATGTVLLGGIKAIGTVTAAFVPMMIVIYLTGAIIVLFMHIDAIPAAFILIFTDAFTGSAATGGFVGSTILIAMRMGVARGLFSNESGMGSAAIAAAAAKTTHPVRQGLVSMSQTFIDTIVVVTFTGLVIICTGTWTMGEGKADVMTAAAFSAGLPGQWGGTIVSVSIVFFAFSTLLGWSYYGERCATSLLGHRASVPYRMLFTMVVFIGATIPLDTVWTIADLLNGLMVLPNLIGLLLLSGLVARETSAYLEFDPELRKSAREVAKFRTKQAMDWK